MRRENERKPLVKNIYTADPSAHVFDGKIYIYPSHDVERDVPDDDDGEQYMMEDYHVLSMDNLDAPCVDNGLALHQDDVPWVGRQMWAPDLFTRNGKYYLVFPAKDKDEIFRLGTAVGDSPIGPFKPYDEPIPGSHSIDPAVLVDDDGKIYCYNGGLYLTEPKEIQILDENGEPLKASDEDRRYFEGPWVHKHHGKYYLSYSTGTTHYICYAEGDRPDGPFTYKGRIMEPVLGWTTHHSIVQIDGDWYLFYHDCELSGGVTHERCVKYTKLNIAEDGTIETIHPYD